MVRISDIHENAVAWSSVPFCDIDDSDIPTYLLQPNDILFARTGGTVGKSFLVIEVPCESIYAGYLIRTRYSSLEVFYGISAVLATVKKRDNRNCTAEL